MQEVFVLSHNINLDQPILFSNLLCQDIYVPDERSELVPWGLCLHNDSPSLAGRIDPSKIRCLHPRVSMEDCRRLRIPSVSQVGTLFCIMRLTLFLGD